MSEWIKCSERMPEDGQYVLIFETTLGCVLPYAVCYFESERFVSLFDLDFEHEGMEFWMPLPTPPTIRTSGDEETKP